MNRPLPAGLISGAAQRDTGHVNNLISTERKFADLVRLLESP